MLRPLRPLRLLRLLRLLCLVLALVVPGAAYAANVVGETHRVAEHAAAAPRDSSHRTKLRITVWYPAAQGSIERPVVIGPYNRPMFLVGHAALDASPAKMPSGGKRPVILLSHGFGGTARVMGWFGIAMARAGYVVIAVDHPGNNALDPMTVPGALLWWERAGDLKKALTFMLKDDVIGSQIDKTRVGLAGFSLGGFTSLVGAGARVDIAAFRRFCTANPTDGVCKPQLEFPVSAVQRNQFADDPSNRSLFEGAGANHSIPHAKAVFVMAPAVVQALNPKSLREIRKPVSIVLGASDSIAPPDSNGVAAARMIDGTELITLNGVGHYNFLADCTPGNDMPMCLSDNGVADAHEVSIKAALKLFSRAL